MDLISTGITEALRLLRNLDPLVVGAAARSLWISSSAVALATLVGLPAALVLARCPFRGRNLVVVVARIGMALPTVFVGLVCYAVFSRRGPLGSLELLYTPQVIVVGELLLAVPIITSLSHGALKSLDPRIDETARTLGASWCRRACTAISEARTGIMLAVLTAFARCVTELGIAVMVGGNLRDRTRTLATATAMETARGEFGRGLAMSLILLGVAIVVTIAVMLLTREDSSGTDKSSSP